MHGQDPLAQESQQRIDNVVEQTRSLEDKYKAVLKEIEGLQVYNTLLQRQIDRQESQKAQFAKSIEEVESINRQIFPLMTKMIDSLDQFVELDVPFLQEERRNRVLGLRETLERQDVSVAEKFRKVTEAYQIENDYGRTIEAYKATIDIGGQPRQVEFLRIGRVAFMYQSEDGTVSGVWDQDARRWEEADAYKNEIRAGLKIAKKQVAPDLLLLPVSAPEAG